MKKNKKTAQWVMLVSGFIMMLTSFLIYKFDGVQFLNEVHSEIFGVGIGLVFIGGVWLLAKIKLD